MGCQGEHASSRAQWMACGKGAREGKGRVGRVGECREERWEPRRGVVGGGKSGGAKEGWWDAKGSKLA